MSPVRERYSANWLIAALSGFLVGFCWADLGRPPAFVQEKFNFVLDPVSMAETLSAASESDDDSDQLVSIHKAARNCNVSQLQRALTAGVSPNSTNDAGRPLIISLCHLLPRNYNQETRLACLDLLRQSPDFDVNAPDRAGHIAIQFLGCHATSRNDVEFMQAVVDAGADVNATGGDLSRTALCTLGD